MSNTKKLFESIQNNLKEDTRDTKYIVCSYYDYKLHDLEDELKTDDWTEATLFAHDKLMNGFMVEIENTMTGKYKIINPDEYNEEFDGEFTIRPEELEESDSNENNKKSLEESITVEYAEEFAQRLDNCEDMDDIQQLINEIPDGALENEVQSVFDQCEMDGDDLDTVKSLISTTFEDNAEYDN